MSDSTLTCHDERRRAAVRAQPDLNGLDYVETMPLRRDDPSQGVALLLFFLGQLPPELGPEHIRIEGGRRIRDIAAVEVEPYDLADPRRDDCALVFVSRQGDLSRYTLRIVGRDDFDPRYTAADFSFRPDCPADQDCAAVAICPPASYQRPEISYLAKDYASFRQLILDRLALIMPGWQERHVPDIGMTLVEILAYAGDHLSYYQDAVATEAYLDTARRRISVRRHVRLVDYLIHEGCNARALLSVDVSQNYDFDAREIYFVTDFAGAPALGEPLEQHKLPPAERGLYEVFEPVAPRRSSDFTRADLRAPARLADRLKDRRDPIALHVRGLLSPDTLLLIDGAKRTDELIERLAAALLADLNRLLLERTLYSPARWSQSKIVVEAELQLSLRPSYQRLRRLNRRLLEQTFPDDIRERGRLYFYKAHNTMTFYSWGDQECCLRRGATSATLRDAWETEGWHGHGRPPRALRQLQPGDLLIFEELIGPKTGNPADADSSRRHAVRLTAVRRLVDELEQVEVEYDEHDQAGRYQQTRTRALPTPLVEIAWAPEDQLPFDLCISTIGPAPECALLEHVSVARGNVVLVDHGRRVREKIGRVPTRETVSVCEGQDQLAETLLMAGRFEPCLAQRPLTFAAPPAADDLAAAVLLAQEPRQALPAAYVRSPALPPIRSPDVVAVPDPNDPQRLRYEREWLPRHDLLNSRAQDTHFVAEIDDEGRACLRFGDGELGALPEAGEPFWAEYRVGNGPRGNVGAEMISRLVLRDGLKVSGVTFYPRNPLPAGGGTAPEPLEHVRLFAPDAFRAELQRAITAEDYAQIVMREFSASVQRAAAVLRWTGSGYLVRVAVDPRGSEAPSEQLLARIAARLRHYRRIGHVVTVEPARYVPLDIAMTVCVQPRFLRGHVRAALAAALGSQARPDGGLGFFHPDSLTFGDGIYLSRLIAVAQAVPGVGSVQITRLERLFEGPAGEIDDGVLPLGPLEIAQLQNDPSLPEHGRLSLTMEGGR